MRAILNDPEKRFAARALTRDVNSAKAQELARAGAEVVAADVDKVETLKRAFDGAHGAYCVTFFWDHFSTEREIADATAMAQAAKAAGVGHVIWSTLEDTRKWVPLSDNRMPTLQGKYKVPHFDAKGESDQLFIDSGVPTTLMLTAFYWDNFIYFGMGPKKGPDGKLGNHIPDGRQEAAGHRSRRHRAVRLRHLQSGQRVRGQERSASRAVSRQARRWRRSSPRCWGSRCNITTSRPRSTASFGFPGADDLGNMFQFKRDFNDYYCGARSLELSKRLNPALQSFAQWVAANKSRIPLE